MGDTIPIDGQDTRRSCVVTHGKGLSVQPLLEDILLTGKGLIDRICTFAAYVSHSLSSRNIIIGVRPITPTCISMSKINSGKREPNQEKKINLGTRL